jgi:thiol-disulfide isomerase/thioredoxin
MTAFELYKFIREIN